eukprot:g11915.t1
MANTEREAILSELEAARAELVTARMARAALTAKHHTAEQVRLEEYATEIRHLSHGNAALQAQCDMASAHLKALSAMAHSSAEQVKSRQSLLYGLLRQMEECEAFEASLPEKDDGELMLNQRLQELSASQRAMSEKARELQSPCTANCEDGVTKRHREIQQRAGRGGDPCKGSLMEVMSCSGPGCEEKDCVWGPWDTWSGCSCTCGGGTMRRNRQVQVSPVGGGKLCDPVDKSEAAECNTMDCEQTCVDARWAGEGRARHRSHAVQASSCGRAATGHAADWDICQGLAANGMEACGTNMGSPACGDRDGRLSEWNTWSDCSCTCFGIRERQRIIEQYHTGQGRPVGHMPLKQVEPCHPRYNEQPPSECIHHHADCKLSQWNEWSQCPVTCGGGNTVRLRYIFTPASNSGRPCLGALRETKPCGEAPCGEGCVDCLWGAWAEWGACSKCGDQRFRQRDILKLPNHCGKMCEPRIAKEVQNCTSDCEKFSFCVWKPWTSWTGCSADCGPATRLRERSLGLVANQPMDFLFKVASDTNAGLCAGTQTDTEACATVPCQNQCVPKNCQFSAWSPWHQPTCIGLCTRSRSISVMNNECGRPCNGALVSTKRCLEECTEVRDCEYRAWTHWTQLDRMDDSGQRYRSREVAQLPKNGGQLCRGDLREVDGVASPEKTPVDCILMPWSTWVGCSRTCGGGWQQRQRGIQDQARNGGRPCLGDLSEGRPCGDFACEEIHLESTKPFLVNGQV